MPEIDANAPLYTLAEGARIVGVAPSTLQNWARGYTYKGVDGIQHPQEALVTTTGAGRGRVLPFVGLAESYVLMAFREAGVPMQRIRPALKRLESDLDLHTALASEQLMTDGAEVLWDFGKQEDPVLGNQLVVVRNGQAVFREVVQQFLSTITYRDGAVALIRLPQYTPEVVVDPRRNYGQPTLATRGIRVADVRARLEAGEPAADVATDYRIALSDVAALAA